MIHAMPTASELLRGNRLLPDDLRQRAVFVEFAELWPSHRCEHFLRIHLTRELLEGGEQEFYRADITQPHRVSQQSCPACRTPMRKVGLYLWECRTPICPTRQLDMRYNAGPVRGVVDVKFEFEANMPGMGRRPISFVIGQERKTIPLGNRQTTVMIDMVAGCCLMLDRRYSEQALEAVYRTAGHLCDQLGFRLK